MTPESYKLFLMIVASLLSYFGVYMIFGALPDKLKGSVYDHARMLMGGAFAILAISIFVFYLTSIQNLELKYRVAYNLSIYYNVSVLMTLSFITLIGKKLNYLSGGCLLSIISCPLYVLTMWGGCLCRSEGATTTIHIIGAIFLFLAIVVEMIFFFKKYRQAVARGDDNFAEDIEIHISWMKRSVYAIIAIGVLCAPFAFSSLISTWLRIAFLVVFISGCTYIFNSFLSFVLVFLEISNKPDQNDEITLVVDEITPMNLSPEIYASISNNIKNWIEEKEYCQSKITIQQVALHFSTNRFYLSTYINTTYKCSFRVWISRLRVAEAKRMMLENPNRTITSVASDVGFLSLVSFTHTFKSIEGVPPRVWLDQNI